MDLVEKVKKMLPAHYEVIELPLGGIQCRSSIGMEEDGPEWQAFFAAVKQWLGSSFQEVFSNVCYRRTDFIIYYRPLR